jgi:hypothetical protein
MSKLLPLLVPLLQIALVAGVCAFCWWRGFPVWIGMIIGVVALIANALLLLWEDDQPGGFNDS